MKKTLIIILAIVLVIVFASIAFAVSDVLCPVCDLGGWPTGNRKIVNGKVWLEYKCSHLHQWWSVLTYDY